MALMFALGFTSAAFSQINSKNAEFHGATATLKQYNVLYILNQGDEKKVKTVMRNINNALEDPRLKGKLKVELIAF